jgi:hypothetical protein
MTRSTGPSFKPWRREPAETSRTEDTGIGIRSWPATVGGHGPLTTAAVLAILRRQFSLAPRLDCIRWLYSSRRASFSQSYRAERKFVAGCVARILAAAAPHSTRTLPRSKQDAKPDAVSQGEVVAVQRPARSIPVSAA